jgi:hypothetical protein
MSLLASDSCLGSRKQGHKARPPTLGPRAEEPEISVGGFPGRGGDGLSISSDAPPFFAKNRNLSDFGGFQSPEVRGRDVKTFLISMIGFQCVAKIEKDNFKNLFHV